MSRYKFQLDPPRNTRPGAAIRWFLASSESDAFAKATEYVSTTSFPSRTRIALLEIEAA
jgi:hypothetical protein